MKIAKIIPAVLDCASSTARFKRGESTAGRKRGGVLVQSLALAWVAALGLSGMLIALTSTASPIQFAGGKYELVLSAVSERTVRVELFALDDNGKPVPPPP